VLATDGHRQKLEETTMKRLLSLLALIACAIFPAFAVQAQGAYPTRPVKIICGFPAGTTLDIVTRIFAQKLEESLGQPFVVENKVGASGNIGAEAASRAAPDGYTLGVGGIAQAISMSMFKTINYNLVKDFEPIAYLSVSPNLLVVNASLGVNSVQELIALAMKNPGKLTYGTAGVGTAPHMSGELFSQITGVKLVHVPYRGTNQAIIDLLGGRLSLMFAPTPTAAPHVKDSRLKFLAITSLKRSSMLPDLPPLADSPGLAGFETSIWQGIWAPKGTPKEIVRRINEVMNKAAATPELKAQLAKSGAEPVIASPEQWGAYVENEVKKWAKVVEGAGIKVQ
jgi:tripartite-type tricarboxylate transporter receptor subunit TctC